MLKRLRHKIGRARVHYLEGGLSNIIELSCAYGYIPPWLYSTHSTYLLRLCSRDRVLKFGPRPGYEYFIADNACIDELAALNPSEDFEAMRRLFLDFLARETLCFAIAKQNRIVAYNWLFQGQYTVTNDGYGPRQLRLILGQRHAMFGNGYISPEYRLKGLFPSLIWMAVNERPADTVFLTTIACMNTDSVRAHERIGFEQLGILRCSRVSSTACRWMIESPSHRESLGRGQPTVQLANILAIAG